MSWAGLTLEHLRNIMESLKFHAMENSQKCLPFNQAFEPIGDVAIGWKNAIPDSYGESFGLIRTIPVYKNNIGTIPSRNMLMKMHRHQMEMVLTAVGLWIFELSDRITVLEATAAIEKVWEFGYKKDIIGMHMEDDRLEHYNNLKIPSNEETWKAVTVFLEIPGVKKCEFLPMKEKPVFTTTEFFEEELSEAPSEDEDRHSPTFESPGVYGGLDLSFWRILHAEKVARYEHRKRARALEQEEKERLRKEEEEDHKRWRERIERPHDKRARNGLPEPGRLKFPDSLPVTPEPESDSEVAESELED